MNATSNLVMLRHDHIERENSLIEAIADNDTQRVEALLKNGMNPNAIQRNGLSALMVAVNTNNPSTIRLLVDHGAAIDLLADNKTALMQAASSDCYVAALQELLTLGANPHAVNRSDETALFYAVTSKNPKTTKIMLSAGSNVNHKNKSGWTPLFFAIGNSKYNIEIMRILISGGADVNASATDGHTPLLSAIAENAIEAVKLLLANNVYPYYVNPSTGDKISVLTQDDGSKPERKNLFDLIRNWLENKALSRHIHADENVSGLAF